MADIKVAFWNVENLFDTTASPLAADFEFTPEKGWTEAVIAAKAKNLASIIRQMHGGVGPDLLGLAEVENKSVVDKLLAEIGRDDYRIAHVESPDIRGIDVTLIYSTKVFKVPKPADMKGHLVHLRYPTRDIFQVRLDLKGNGGELTVLVNHWPSRRQGQYESEPHRITVAEHCGRLVDAVVKLPRDQFLALPNTAESLSLLNERWNRNVLVMGDLNDEPFNRSVLDYLLASKDLDHVEEEVKPASNSKLPAPDNYLGRRAYLFNAMWPQLAKPDVGTLFFGTATNSMNLLDQFMVTRGLLFGNQKLQFVPASVEIFRAPDMTSPKGRPKGFDRKTQQGFSDHFPITALIRTV